MECLSQATIDYVFIAFDNDNCPQIIINALFDILSDNEMEWIYDGNASIKECILFLCTCLKHINKADSERDIRAVLQNIYINNAMHPVHNSKYILITKMLRAVTMSLRRKSINIQSMAAERTGITYNDGNITL